MASNDVNMTDPADEQLHSESELATIATMTLWYQMPYLSTRRLMQLNSDRCPVWNRCNIPRIAEARRQDATRDWYFPLIVKKKYLDVDWGQSSRRELADKCEGSEVLVLPAELTWKWSGIWHSTAHHASARVHTLPPMTYLPHEWFQRSFPRGDIVASAGGLLLIKSTVGAVPLRRSRRLNPLLADSNPTSVSDITALPQGTWRRSRNREINAGMPLLWQRLLVCNPLTKECRELPAANCQQMGWETWLQVYSEGVQAMMVVDDAANSYQVILTLKNFVAVYTSTTNSWNCVHFPDARPWACHRPRRSRSIGITATWWYRCASAHVGGRLYFADVKSTGAYNRGMEPSQTLTRAATLRLFEVDTEARRWDAPQLFSLWKFHVPHLKGNSRLFFDLSILPHIEIAECMEELYTIIPAKIHDVLLVGEEQSVTGQMDAYDCADVMNSELQYMPLCFYIMQLQGHGVGRGVLRIQVPRTRSDLEFRCRRLTYFASKDRLPDANFFSCHARGSVIWVSFEDYLLSYDVVSRESKTQIIPLNTGTNKQFKDEELVFAYRPSFHIKP